MNANEAKKVAGTLRFIEAMAESIAESVYSEDGVSEELIEAVDEKSGHLHEAVKSLLRGLWTIEPEFAEGLRMADAEAVERGRIWSEQRAEQLRLLRLAGDDTPEEDVPIGPFTGKGGAA